MFETATPSTAYEDEWGRRRWRRRRRWQDDDDETMQEFESDRYESGAGPAELADREDEYEDEGDGEFEDEGEGEDEDQFFQALIPLAAKVLPSLLGALGGKEAELEDGEAGQAGQAEEELLGKLLGGLFGRETELAEAPLTPAQEAGFAGRLLEVGDHRELEQLVGKIVDAVGNTVQGVRNAARTPQGRALVQAATPVLEAAVPQAEGPPAEAVFELEAAGMGQEQQAYEAARQGVRLAAAAAQHVANAAPEHPAEVVGEFGLLNAARRFAPRLFRAALPRLSPFVRRGYGHRYGWRGGYRGARYRRPYYRPPYRGWRGPGWGYRSYGYAPTGYVPTEPPPPEQPPEPPPSRPGYRWVQVPDVPEPTPPPPPPPAEPPAPPGSATPPTGSEWEYGYGAPQGADGQSGRWERRRGKIVVLGA
ncbi:hypothetical protein [Paractinoplanes globisporus]|uniref:Uncharacterized protein n=1 Tax=Paractinoplanes globisporus TaxID=113565 RepID=A0ABW6WNS8_9ACTN|nr:hypothetical protein [Actinoplanes globisporus]